MRRLGMALAALGAALAAAPAAVADSTPPALYIGVAVSYNVVRLQPTKPIDPNSVQPSDFFLNMAGADRQVTSASVNGGFIYISSPNAWGVGQAGIVHLTAPGAISDTEGNPSVSTADVHVGGAPGDLTPPSVHRLRILPKRNMCMSKTRRCKSPGGRFIFNASEDGYTWITVYRGRRLIGTRKFVARQGDNYFKWDGKINGRRLGSGGYKVYVGVEDQVGNVTPAQQQPSQKITVSNR